MQLTDFLVFRFKSDNYLISTFGTNSVQSYVVQLLMYCSI